MARQQQPSSPNPHHPLDARDGAPASKTVHAMFAGSRSAFVVLASEGFKGVQQPKGKQQRQQQRQQLPQ